MRFASLIAVAGLSFGLSATPYPAHAADVYYTLTYPTHPNPEVLAITVSEDKITMSDVGPAGVPAAPLWPCQNGGCSTACAVHCLGRSSSPPLT
jgi:hypothetical protein